MTLNHKAKFTSVPETVSSSGPTFKTLPVNIVIPVVLTILLFILTIYLILIPLLEKNMLETKRQGKQQLTESALSAIETFHAKEQSGEVPRAKAIRLAIQHLGSLRYGPELADYFWINDMTPRMIMHPYRPDLVGKDVSDFKDPAGKKLFAQMVLKVKLNGAGFVDYLWQSKDNPDKNVPKISYVMGFEPWGWVIGTGIYVDDVRQEIRAITRQMTAACSVILFIFLIVSAYIVWQGAKTKKEQIAALEQNRIKEKQLIQADKMTSLGILVAGVAHEVNNPITSIMLNAPNLKKAWQSFLPILDRHFQNRPDENVCNMPYPELGKRIRMMLDGIEDSAARVKKIITELKDFSRPASTDINQVIDVNQMTNQSLDLTRSLLKKSTHNLFVSLDEGLPDIQGNLQKLQQVLINLIVNACQALESQEESIQVKTKLSDNRDTIIIIVADSGPGVTSEQLARIKEPFFTTKRDDGGSGLGLSICEKIVNDHNGILDFESAPGQGLTATIMIPVSQPGTKKDKS